VFFHDGPPKAREEISMTGNFWYARAYATNGDGEVVRVMLKEERDFEDLCLKGSAIRNQSVLGGRSEPISAYAPRSGVARNSRSVK
jgi:hypothetical protein